MRAFRPHSPDGPDAAGHQSGTNSVKWLHPTSAAGRHVHTSGDYNGKAAYCSSSGDGERQLVAARLLLVVQSGRLSRPN